MVINEPPGKVTNLVAWLREEREVALWSLAGTRLALQTEKRRREFWSWLAMAGWTLFALHLWWRW